jgi:hypothetical protein
MDTKRLRHMIFYLSATVLAILGAYFLIDPEGAVRDALPQTLSTLQPPRYETLTLRLSMVALVSDSEPGLSSQRTEDDLREILAGMNEVWSPAGIQFEPGMIAILDVPAEVLRAGSRGNMQPFMDQVFGNFATDPGTITGFYARNIGGANGFTPANLPVFFVTDTPTVYDRRVSSHEVGHILGLSHVTTDPDHLMSSGTNGMVLAPAEIETARAAASRLIRQSP